MSFGLKLYLLALEKGKFYVGQSDNPKFRFNEHLAGTGSKWTRMFKPIKILKVQTLSLDNNKHAMLYENWMTLQAMERYGWENVRGGDYLVVENYRLQGHIDHIYDCDTNKIRYYVTGNRYLFGTCDDWLIYVLELCGGKFYVGSCKHLGKSLGEHFSGKDIAWTRDHLVIRVLEIITVKQGTGSWLEVKQSLLNDYILRYGWDNVLGAPMPPKDFNGEHSSVRNTFFKL
jgi:predicted GIY-YIG superfamily endonuclease